MSLRFERTLWIDSLFMFSNVLIRAGERDEVVAASLERQVASILDAQDPETGLWWTSMNRPGEIYVETSATALFAAGLPCGFRQGIPDVSGRPAIGARHGRRALAHRGGRGGRPVVPGIAGPTTAGRLDDHAEVELGDISYGVGAVVLAPVETSGL
ncbi:glycoside hydrolase family 88 protein [Sorangium sp. So ce296]|uniref:glycoside hydrolase family 88 protein n=1 Tax=Sorangium sp. So ce296 TaxID=3133296 RepID=UPI003F604BB3